MNLNLEEFLSYLPVWDRFFDSHASTRVLSAEAELLEIRMRLANLRRRLRDGPHAPLRIAFFGPTGAGKSKLFSSLIGCNVSGSGYQRPYTRRAQYYIHDRWRALVPTLEGEVEVHEDDRWQDVVLIDSPDFDSVESENRAEAERVFLESDRFLFVTDALKYADASTWEYLDRIKLSRKKFVTILNKTSSETVQQSFRERFLDTFGAEATEAHAHVPDVVVPELPLGDDVLIDPELESMQSLGAAVTSLTAGNHYEASSIMFRSELQGLFMGGGRLSQRVEERQTQLADLQQRIAERYERSTSRLESRLCSGLGPVVRDEVYQRVLKRLDKIDVLRYPRRVISAPIRGLKSLITGWWSGNGKGEQAEAPEKDNPVTSETFHLLESELIRFADETRLDVISQPGWEQVLDRDKFREVRLDHDDIQLLFNQHHEQFTDWVADHARDTAAQITGENKAKFILSQVLFNTVLITAQVHTGGALSLLELGVDGMLSPFVAKAVGVAIGNEKVKEFEEQAHRQHQDSLSKIIAEQRQRFEAFLNQQTEGLQELGATLNQITAFSSLEDEIVKHFQGQPTAAGEGRGDRASGASEP